MKFFLGIVLMVLPFLSLAQTPKATAPSATMLNGLQKRKGQELGLELTRHAAEVASLTKQQAALQAKVAAATDAKVKGQLETRLTQSTKQLTAAQKSQTNAGAAMSDWTTKTLTTHKASAGSSIDWTHGTIAAK